MFDTTAEAPPASSKTFLAPPKLVAPDAVATMERTEALRWNAVDGASCYLIEFKEYLGEVDGLLQSGETFCTVFVPQSAGDVITAQLPGLPATGDLTGEALYVWTVTAVSVIDGAVPASSTEADQLSVMFQKDGDATSEGRLIRLK